MKDDNEPSEVFSSSDLGDMWEDIISVAGYNNPDVVATTGRKRIQQEKPTKGLNPDQIRLNKKIIEIKNLQNKMFDLEEKLREEK